LNEGDMLPISDLLKREVRDSEDREVGHLEDLCLDLRAQPPAVTGLAVHLGWTDKVGPIVLPRPVEDIVMLMPWSEVEGWDEDQLWLRHPHSEFQAISSAEKTLVRRDILNKQIVDEEGNRLHRVDDVLLRREDLVFFLEGLQVGTEWLPAGSRVGKLVNRLRRRYDRPGEMNIIPYEAIMHVDADILVIRGSAGIE
jgi:sporulation protein YlmC with PRC-barrel domain